MNAIGIDLGGTKIMAGVVNAQGEVLAEVEVGTPAERGREAILESIKNVVHRLRAMSTVEIQTIGIGSAGRIHSKTGKVLFATDNLPGWTGTEVKMILEAECSLPVFVENDVNVAALGEGWLGAAPTGQHYIFVALGTGIGGALVHNGRVVTSPEGAAGELGHMILYPNGLPCNCGQLGCFEQYASGTALNRLARRVHADWDSHSLMKHSADGDPVAAKVIRAFVTDLATGLVSVQNFYDPEMIVLGGGVMETHHLWWETLKDALKQVTPFDIHVVPSRLGKQAGMIGAARLAMDGIGQPDEKKLRRQGDEARDDLCKRTIR